ncbi:hypothetical protein QTG54_001485 [Skeletonema marinoi]|uniref:Uncharacterized protein n=1 Tax=Skeletonema marinoi TaxID=267567 RepID=A0AAD9DHM4_9STRA|nr:hypothetical protein QTG54_001485 [Skeletonema marinoi]
MEAYGPVKDLKLVTDKKATEESRYETSLSCCRWDEIGGTCNSRGCGTGTYGAELVAETTGGGLGGTRLGGKDKNIFMAGRFDPSKQPVMPPPPPQMMGMGPPHPHHGPPGGMGPGGPMGPPGFGGPGRVVHRNMDTTMIVDLLLVMAVVAVDMMIVVHLLDMVVAVDLMIVVHRLGMAAGGEGTMIVGLHLGIISVGDMVVVVVVTMMVDMEVIGREEDHPVRQDVGGTNVQVNSKCIRCVVIAYDCL